MITTSCLKHSWVNPSHIVPGLEYVVEVIIMPLPSSGYKRHWGFHLGHVFFMFSVFPSPFGSRVLVKSASMFLAVLWRVPWSEKLKSLVNSHWLSLEVDPPAPVKPWTTAAMADTLATVRKGLWGRTTQLNYSWIPKPQKLWSNEYCFIALVLR